MGWIKWTAEEKEYLENSWGEKSIPTIAKKLGRTIVSVKVKATKMGLTRHIHSGEYITFNQLMIALGRKNYYTYSLKSWIENRDFPIKYKNSLTKKYMIVYLNDFWEWAKVNRTFIDFSKVKENILGIEPSWVKEQRIADIHYSTFKKTPWTKEDDDLLRGLLNCYKYSYREISLRIKRTEGAIARRMVDLKIKQRPLKADNHTPWTDAEVKTLMNLLDKGYKVEVIAEFIDRSAKAISGKIDRMKKENLEKVT